MATYTRRFTNSDQHWIIRFLPLETLSNAQALARRFKEVDGARAVEQVTTAIESALKHLRQAGA